MNQEKINFHVARDFSELFNTAVKFTHQNFKHFFKILLFIAGPFILISSIVGALYQSHALQFATRTPGMNAWNYITNQFGWEYFVFLIFNIFSALVLLTTAYSYMIIYNQRGPKNFNVTDVKALVWKNIGRTLKGFLILLMIFGAIILLISIIAGLLISALKLIAAVLMVLLILALLVISPPFAWQFSTFYLVLIGDEDISISDALRRVREVMRGEFFSTWLLIIASFVVLMILAFIFTVPQFIYQIVIRMGSLQGNATGTTPFLIVTAVCTFFSTFIYSLFYIVCGLHYYSLAEKKDGTALINRIDEIGNTPSDDVDQQY